MSKRFPPITPAPPIAIPMLLNIRRRMVPLTGMAAAIGLTTGLAGCGMLGGGDKPEPAMGPVTTISPDSTASQVQAFTAGMDAALAKVDKEKFKAAAQKPAQPAAQAEATSATPPAAAKREEGPSAEVSGREAAAEPAPSQLQLPGYLLAIANPPAVSVDSVSPIDLAMLTAPAEPVADPRPTVEAALETLRNKVAARPTLNTALALALLDGSEGKTADADLAKELSAPDQKILQDLLGALSGMNTPGTPGTTLSDRALPLLDAANRWKAPADTDLNLPKLALASRVDSYGVYTRLEPRFPAGKKQTVIIYCEVANFVPKKTDDGWFETRLSQQETLATDDGLLIFRPNAEDVEDRSKNQRRDFYLVKKLIIPDNLPVGKYALRMSVTDKNTNKIAVVTLPIEIVK